MPISAFSLLDEAFSSIWFLEVITASPNRRRLHLS
jgi:hypothetical protein